MRIDSTRLTARTDEHPNGNELVADTQSALLRMELTPEGVSYLKADKLVLLLGGYVHTLGQTDATPLLSHRRRPGPNRRHRKRSRPALQVLKPRTRP
jgi:hypothetical protein